LKGLGEKNGVILKKNGQKPLYLFAGRQIACAERIEILALTVDTDIPDKLPAIDAVQAVLDEGGVPVMSWAPGKWMFKRRNVVAQILDRFQPGQLLIGDSSLRPAIWKEPLLMQTARKVGFGIVAGSDPLPFPGEERYLGTFGSILDGSFDTNRPVSSVRKMLTEPEKGFMRIGKGCSINQMIYRLIKNAAEKRLSEHRGKGIFI
jgi:hypothetical protein